MTRFALSHPDKPREVWVLARPLTSYAKDKQKGLISFECLNGAWQGKYDPIKGVIHIRDDDLRYPVPAIKVWEGEPPPGGYNETIEWITTQIKYAVAYRVKIVPDAEPNADGVQIIVVLPGEIGTVRKWYDADAAFADRIPAGYHMVAYEHA